MNKYDAFWIWELFLLRLCLWPVSAWTLVLLCILLESLEQVKQFQEINKHTYIVNYEVWKIETRISFFSWGVTGQGEDPTQNVLKIK